MTPNDVYRATKNRKVPETFYASPTAGVSYDDLNLVNLPDFEDIGEYQMKTAISMITEDPRLKKAAHILNQDITAPLGSSDESIAINEALTKIEQALSAREAGSATRIAQRKDLHNNVKAMMSVYEDLEKRLSFVCTLIKSSGGAIAGSQLLKELERVEQGITLIKQNLTALGESSANIVTPEVMGFLKSAEWLGRRIKGKYLEVVGTQWFNQHLPNNIKAVNVGKVQGPAIDILGKSTGASKMLRTDIMLFDLDSAVRLTFSIGDKRYDMSVKEFTEFMNKQSDSTTVTLSDSDYESMKKALVAGVQAKAGQNQAIFNPKPASISQVIQLEGRASEYAKALELLTKLWEEERSNSEVSMQQTSDAYQALFNYCLGKGLQALIGKENTLILTRDGVMTVKDYLFYQWNHGERKIAQAKTRVNIKFPDKMIPIYFSGASFISKS